MRQLLKKDHIVSKGRSLGISSELSTGPTNFEIQMAEPHLFMLSGEHLFLAGRVHQTGNQPRWHTLSLSANEMWERSWINQSLLSEVQPEDAKTQEQLRSEKIIATIRRPFEQLVGKPAREFPAGKWLGDSRPTLEGRPYLIHFWAVWHGPGHIQFQVLRQMSSEGATIIGFHPGDGYRFQSK